LYCARSHLYLHSFPTRRSSDLITTLPPLFGATSAMTGYETERHENAGGIMIQKQCESNDFSWQRRQFWFNVLTEKSPLTQLEHADRKSTRLNSSHVAISYAVFC